MLIAQYFIIALIVSFAAYYLFKKIKSELKSGSCETGCGKCEAAKSFGAFNG